MGRWVMWRVGGREGGDVVCREGVGVGGVLGRVG